MNRKVLIISYYWPPAGGPAVQRVLKFTQHLPQFGWQPVIVTVEDGDYPVRDESLAAQIPADLNVYRFPIPEPYTLYRKILGKAPGEPIPIAELQQGENAGWKKRLLHSVRANLFIPDARIGWYFTAAGKIMDVIKKENIEALMVTSPPHSLQLLGRKLQKQSGLPLISDLRDPWTDIFYYRNVKRWAVSRRIDSRMEKSLLSATDCAVVVSPAIARLYAAKTPVKRMEVIPNGYDREEMAAAEATPRKDKFVISYTGNLSAAQDVPALWSALQSKINSEPEFSEDLELNFTGHVHEPVLDSIKKAGLTSFFRFENFVPHQQVVLKLKQSSVLLLIIPAVENNDGILTGKLFDYLASRRPVLAIGPVQGDAAKILEDAESGKMIAFTDEQGIRSRIDDLFKTWKSGKPDEPVGNAGAIAAYERKALTGQLATVLNDVTERDYDQN